MRISDCSSDVCSSDLAPVFYVRADSPFKTMKDVVDYAKANPGKLKFGVGTAASIDRMVVETMKIQQDLDMVVATHDSGRPEERRVGNEGVSTCRARGAAHNEKKKNKSYIYDNK